MSRQRWPTSPGVRVVQAEPKRPMQFSKKQVVFADAIVVVIWIGEFILRLLGKEGVSDVAIAIITAYGAFATGGYFTLAGARDCSKNKHQIKEEDLG